MKSLSSVFQILSLFLLFILIPTPAYANDMGGIAFLFFAAFFLVFLIGYLPYLFLSLTLAYQSTKPEGIKKSTNTWASIFVGINTLVFLGSFVLVLEFGATWVLADILLWGIPFLLYLKGIRSSPKN